MTGPAWTGLLLVAWTAIGAGIAAAALVIVALATRRKDRP